MSEGGVVREQLYLDEPFYRAMWMRDAEHMTPAEHYARVGIEQGLLANPGQLGKWYPAAGYDETAATMMVGGVVQGASDFLEAHMQIDQLEALLLQETENTLSSRRELLIVVTSSNDSVAAELIEGLEPVRTFANLCLTYIGGVAHPASLEAARRFPSRLVCTSKNAGSDIPPFVATYKRALRDATATGLVLKLHTKTDRAWRETMTSGFQNDNLLASLGKMAASPRTALGRPLLRRDVFNLGLILRNMLLPHDAVFVGGTTFLAARSMLDGVVAHAAFKTAYRATLRTASYYDNLLFLDNSPVHAMERLFGYIPCASGFKWEEPPAAKDARVLLLYAAHTSNNVKARVTEHNLRMWGAVKGPWSIDYRFADSIGCDRLAELDSLPGPLVQVENDGTLDTGKWLHLLEAEPDLDKYDYVVLANDSVVYLRPPGDFLAFAVATGESKIAGILESWETGWHLQSWLRAVPGKLVGRFADFLSQHVGKCHIYAEHVAELEVGAAKHFAFAGLYAVPRGCRNVMFSDDKLEAFVREAGFPALKLRKINWPLGTPYSTDALPADFTPARYAAANPDLPKSFSSQDYTSHFTDHGWKEGRLHYPGQPPRRPEYLQSILRDYAIEDMFQPAPSGTAISESLAQMRSEYRH